MRTFKFPPEFLFRPPSGATFSPGEGFGGHFHRFKRFIRIRGEGFLHSKTEEVVTHFLRCFIQLIYRNTTGFLYPAAFSLSIFVIIARNASGKARLFMGQPATQRIQLMQRSLSVWLGHP